MPRSLLTILACFVLSASVETTFSQGWPTIESPAVSLHAKYKALQDKLTHNQFQRPLYLESNEKDDALQGEVYAVLDYPFAALAESLKESSVWCDILSLHLNIKYCRTYISGSSRTLLVYVGRKFEQPLEDAWPVRLNFHAETDANEYLRVVLYAEKGPFETHNYRIVLESIPVGREKVFIRLSYSYETGLMAKLAMRLYLNTLGGGKVGFTVIGRDSEGRPIYIETMRGVIERNAMRYYLAVEAYLSTLTLPKARQLEARLQNCFAATEHYSLQLHEMEKAEYLIMKRKEHERQILGGTPERALP